MAGAGIAGLTLASRLAAAGVEVLLLEAGGLEPGAGALEGEPRAWEGESRAVEALGGSSLVWGGQLLGAPAEVTGTGARGDWPGGRLRLRS